MNNYKIKVSGKDESKEVQELFESLGYEKGACSLGNYPAVIVTTQDWATGNYCSTRALGLDIPAHDNYTEITLAELRDMVVLKRNDRADANVEEENCLYDLYLTKLGDLYFYHCGKNKWILSNISGDESYYKSLKPIEKTMKEYLIPNRNFKYILTDAREGLEPHAKDWTEIPVWANYAYKNDAGICFLEGALGFNHPLLVWQRPTQPEELPFIDDEPRKSSFMTPEQQGRFTEGAKKVAESFVKLSKGLNIHEPQSLNDQYAETEKVRQNGLKFDNGKPRHSLLPKGSISSVIAVLEFGAKKYEANNWQKVDNAKERYYDAAMRHIDSWWNGEKFDQETGIHHLAHAATNLFFLKWFDDKGNNNG